MNPYQAGGQRDRGIETSSGDHTHDDGVEIDRIEVQPVSRVESLAEEHESSRQEVLEGSDREAADLALGARERQASEAVRKAEERERSENGGRLDQQLEAARTSIAQMDPNVALSEQPRELRTTATVNFKRLLTKLLNAGVELQEWGNFPRLTAGLARRAHLGSLEILILEKLQENPQSALTESIQEDWDRWLAQAKANLEAAQEIERNEGPWYERALGYATEHPVKTVALVGIGAVGIWGAVKLAKSLFKGESASGAETGIAAATVGGALLSLGSILKPGTWIDWLKENLNLNLSPSNLLKFITGGFNLETLKEGIVAIDDRSRRAATQLGVDAEQVAALSDMPYEQFTDDQQEMQRLLFNAAHHIADSLGLEAPISPSLFDQSEHREQVRATTALMELLDSPEAKAALNAQSPATVGEALAILEREGVLTGVPQEGTESEENAPESDPSGEELEQALAVEEMDLFGEGEDQIGISEENWTELEEILEGKSATRAALQEMEGVTSWMNPLKLWNFCEAAYEDGMAIVQNDNEGLMLWTGTKYILLSPLRIVGNTFKEAMQAFSGAESLEEGGRAAGGAALRTYVDESLGFIVLFGAPAIVKGLIQMGTGRFVEGGKTIGRGLVRSVTVPAQILALEAQAAVRVADAGADLKRWGQEQGYRRILLKKGGGPEMVARRNQARLDRLKFYADQYRKFDEQYRAARERGWFSEEEGVSNRRHIGRRVVGQLRRERVASLRAKYGSRFANEFNTLRRQNVFNGELGHEFIGKEGIQADNFEEKLTQFREHYDAKKNEVLRQKVDARVNEIRQARQSASGWEKFNKESIRRMLLERGIDPKSPEATKYLEVWDRAIAEQEIRGQKFNPNVKIQVQGVRIKPRIEALSSRGPTTYRYMGIEITIPQETLSRMPTEEVARQKAIRTYCEQKLRIPAAQALEVEPGRALENGQRSYRINGREVTATDLDSAKARYLDALKEGSREIPEGFEQRLRTHMSWAPAAELVLGTVGVAFLIYELETAPDKQEAVTKALAMIGTALGGAKVFERTLGRRSANPYFHLFGNLAFGIMAVMGFGEDAEAILGAVLERIPGIEEASPVIANLIEVQAARKWAIQPILRQAPRLAGKAGLTRLEGFMVQKVNSRLLVGIERIAAKTGFKTILKALGWRGAAAGVMFANDATVIGVADDVIAIGLLAWSAKDIYEIVTIMNNAQVLKEELEKRKNAPIEDIQLAPDDEARLVTELTGMGYQESQIYANGKINPQILEQIPETRLYSILNDSTFTLKHEGIEGNSTWTIQGGEPIEITIYEGDNQTVLASMTQEQTEQVETSIAEYEEAQA